MSVNVPFPFVPNRPAPTEKEPAPSEVNVNVAIALTPGLVGFGETETVDVTAAGPPAKAGAGMRTSAMANRSPETIFMLAMLVIHPCADPDLSRPASLRLGSGTSPTRPRGTAKARSTIDPNPAHQPDEGFLPRFAPAPPP